MQSRLQHTASLDKGFKKTLNRTYWSEKWLSPWFHGFIQFFFLKPMLV